jgi:uncharacterized heparinase superfamily protein
MPSRGFAGRLRRGLRKPPRVIARRIRAEATTELERVRAPRRAAAFGEAQLLRATDAPSVEQLWTTLLGRAPFRPAFAAGDHDHVAAGDRQRVLIAAEAAVARVVDILGSGPVELGTPIDWHRDFKTGHVWPPRFWRSIEYANRDRPSDVKIPWELSRLQWLIPCGQAYVLTSDERFAIAARDIVDEWIGANPYAMSVNWAVTMEVAIRILSLTWLFGALGASAAWAEPAFRVRFLCALYLHGDFTSRNLEWSDVNGNHYTADAAGLCVAGTFFGRSRWADEGWRILCEELPLQVHPDGVDFESSTAYHRLVAELFLLPALYREQVGAPVPTEYRDRIVDMGRFAAAYTRPDGSAPAWGDTDDARALPLGGAEQSDHRHLVGAIGAAWDVPELRARFSGSRAEVSWLLGPERAKALPEDAEQARSVAFRHGGVYVLAGANDHVFVDCGPVGLAGRGGHGHNDCLSFDAYLDGVPVVVDPGSYVYTASWEWRNRFRSTKAHNTPALDGREQATLDPGLLWTLGAEAVPELREFDVISGRFVGAHRGYANVGKGVVVVRSLELDSERHRLTILDRFEGSGDHTVSVPLQLSERATVELDGSTATLRIDGRRFAIRWQDPNAWTLSIDPAWVSPSYGVKREAPRLLWIRSGPLCDLHVEVEPT